MSIKEEKAVQGLADSLVENLSDNETSVYKIGKFGDQHEEVEAWLIKTGIPISKQDDRQASTRLVDLETDPLENEYLMSGENKLLEPPYDSRVLLYLYENNNTLMQCINAMSTNIEGFGYDLVDIVEDEDIRDSLSESIKEEKDRLKRFFEYASVTHDWVHLRKLVRVDLEATGNGYLEVIRYETGEIAGFEYLPSKDMRMSVPADDLIEVPMKVRVYENGEYVYKEEMVYRKFRKYAQVVDGSGGVKKVWFKEFGDMRDMDRRNGNYLDDIESIKREGAGADTEKVKSFEKIESGRVHKRGGHVRKVAEQTASPDESFGSESDSVKTVMGEIPLAHEIVHFSIEHPKYEYGVPRWIGNLLSVMGSRDADEVNQNFFVNGAMFDFAILVSGGTMNEDAVLRIKEFVRKNKGKDKAHGVLVIQSEAPATFNMKTGQTSSIELRELNKHEDMMFEKYQKFSMDRIRSSFRLAPLYIGLDDDYTDTNAKTSKQVTEEQVFVPERNDTDFWVNRFLFTELEVKYHQYRTKGPNMSRAEEMKLLLEAFKNVITGRELRRLLSGVIDTKLDDVENMDDIIKLWLDYPAPIALKLIELGAKAAGDSGSGIPAEEEPEEVEPEEEKEEEEIESEAGTKAPLPKKKKVSKYRNVNENTVDSLNDVARFVRGAVKLGEMTEVHNVLKKIAGGIK